MKHAVHRRIRTVMLAVATAFAATLAQAKQPNVIFIYADDHSERTIGAYGSTINRTPNIDSLAAEGMLFRQSFVANSICGPARACVLSGLHSAANGQVANGARFNADVPTFAKSMQANGYQTAAIGKWHLAGDQRGFDYYAISHGYYLTGLKTPTGRKPVKGYTTEVLTDESIEWIKNRDPNKPFTLWLCHNASHRTWMPGTQYLNRYDDVTIPEPDTLFDDHEGRNPGTKTAQMRISDDLFPAYDLKLPVTGEGILDRNATGHKSAMSAEARAAWEAAYGPKNEAFAKANLSGKALVQWKYQRYMKDYLRCIDAIDDSVGKLLAFLKESGLEEDTIVVYSADQGFFLGEHGWYDKRWMYEEAMRTPLIVRWPGVVKAGTTCNELVQNIDMAPTFLEAAGIAVPASMHGSSLVPLLKGKKPDAWRDAVYYHYQMNDGNGRLSHRVAKHYGVRTDRYKLIYVYEHDFWELYDLQRDPKEMKNVYSDPEYRAIVQQLTKKLQSLREAYDTTGKPIPDQAAQ